MQTVKLNNGTEIPAIGFGVYHILSAAKIEKKYYYKCSLFYLFPYFLLNTKKFF